jgi:regulator of protease activity HflC (stomatin/prohibitin superfamily)
MIRLNPNERLLIVNGANHYRLVGPGWVWLKPWQQALVKLDLGPQSQSLDIEEVRTLEHVPVDVTAQILYQIDPVLCSEELLPKLPQLSSGGWQGILRWRLEHILRQMLADYAWRDVGKSAIRQRLERQLTQTMAEYLKPLGLRISAVCLVKIGLPGQLQQTIIRAERDSIEPRGRAAVLKGYFDIFGPDIARAMPYIVQWELVNTLHKNGKAQFLFSDSALFPNGQPAGPGAKQPVYQMSLPMQQES